MPRTYRKEMGSDIWHFWNACPNWPTEDYEESDNEPTTGEICTECGDMSIVDNHVDTPPLSSCPNCGADFPH